MISVGADRKIMLAVQPVDFCKSVYTLSALVREAAAGRSLLRRRFYFLPKLDGPREAIGVERLRACFLTKWLDDGFFTPGRPADGAA